MQEAYSPEKPNWSLVSLLLPLAEPSLGAVSDVTAGGVIGSGTHNTGIKHGILATQVGPLLPQAGQAQRPVYLKPSPSPL